jgi:hypothetical protein
MRADTAAAILYPLKLWPALTCYCDDGRIDDFLPWNCAAQFTLA